MAYTVLIQPNGNLALFDSVGQEIVLYDTTEAAIVDHMVERSRSQYEGTVRDMAARARAGNTRITYDQAIKKMIAVHGEEEVYNLVESMAPETPPHV